MGSVRGLLNHHFVAVMRSTYLPQVSNEWDTVAGDYVDWTRFSVDSDVGSGAYMSDTKAREGVIA